MKVDVDKLRAMGHEQQDPLRTTIFEAVGEITELRAVVDHLNEEVAKWKRYHREAASMLPWDRE